MGWPASVWGVGWVIVFLAIVNSVTACGNAANITTTRTLYAMSRAGVLPDKLVRTNRAPGAGTGSVAHHHRGAGRGPDHRGLWGPEVAATFLLDLTSAIIIVLYLVAAVTCVIPVLPALPAASSAAQARAAGRAGRSLLVQAFLATFGIRAFRFVTPLAWPESLITPIVIAWVVIGIGAAVYLKRTRTQGVNGVRDLYAESVSEPEAAATTAN